MRINTQDYNDITVVTLQGELDADAVDTLRNTITDIINLKTEGLAGDEMVSPAVRKNGIVLDMNNVGFIDGQGLEFLLWTRDYCNENQCQFRLAGLDENCSKILEITRLNNEFACYIELTEAVKSFA